MFDMQSRLRSVRARLAHRIPLSWRPNALLSLGNEHEELGGFMRRLIACVVAFFLAAVCAVEAPAARAADPQPSAPAPSSVSEDYRLGPGDKLHITTFGETDLTGDFEVGTAGTVAFPLVGDVAAAGLTVPEFVDKLQTALSSGYLKDPRVNVEVLTYRPFYILGEVTKPGEYPYTNGLTVLNAVATANGFTYRANTKRVFIKHAKQDHEESYPLTSTTPVRPGDTVRIAERVF
jgi:polysaccharide export outer membrane protein